MDETARVSITYDGNSVTVVGSGTLDLTNSKEFHDGLKEASLNAESVAVDLRCAEFIDTAIVQDLGMAAVTLLKRGKRLKVIVSGRAYPLKVLRISSFDSIMDIESEPDSA